MADPIDDAVPPATPRCPWCSSELPDPAAAACPSCKANLAGGTETAVPGLTALDLERLAFRRSTTPKKSRLLSWISGDSAYEDATDPVAAPGSLAPPPAAVRREMLRIERAALIADLAAEAGALATDDALALGEADPAAAAAAIQAQLDVAARAQAEDVAADDVRRGSSTGDEPGSVGSAGAAEPGPIGPAEGAEPGPIGAAEGAEPGPIGAAEGAEPGPIGAAEGDVGAAEGVGGPSRTTLDLSPVAPDAAPPSGASAQGRIRRRIRR
jgi:hypothetical protein